MTHDDGAIGFLYVLPQFRGRGYAREIMHYIIGRLRQRDLTPFCHLEPANTPAMNLSKKSGL